MLTNLHRILRCTLAKVTATATAIVTAAGLMVAVLPAMPAQAAPLGSAPDARNVRHFQTGTFKTLRWSAVSGATAYQVFIKHAKYHQHLPREWTLLRTVRRNYATVAVRPGQTRQFGVRAVGRVDGARKQVTAISSFGTISRPARLSDLTKVRRWRTLRSGRYYRGVAYEARRPRAKLHLRYARGTSSIRLIGQTGRGFGTVDVYLAGRLVKRVDFGQGRRNASKQLAVSVPRPSDGTITVVTRSRKPVRISAIGHTRPRTRARRTPAAPLAHRPASSFTIRGSGWGHGIGLSQYGAKAMADDGRNPAQILRHYYSGTQIDTAADNRLINVNVAYHWSSLGARLRALDAGAEVRVCAMRGASCAQSGIIRDSTAGSRTAGAISVWRTSAGDVRAMVTDERGQATRVTGDRLRIRWSGTDRLGGHGSVLRLENGREYRHGEMLVTGDGTSRLNAVVRMQLQSEYLRGVAEMPSSWDLDALRAQAIIARTYALRTGAGRKADCACHLRDSVVHQAYTGWAKESEGYGSRYGKRWVSAVNSTDGTVLTYRGALAGTFYFSSSGGHTLNSQDVWSSRVPYLQSVDDPWSMTSDNPNRSWSMGISQSRMASLFGLRDLYKVEVASRYAGGAVRSVRATASNGDSRTISGKADYMRSRFGLKSAWITSITAN